MKIILTIFVEAFFFMIKKTFSLLLFSLSITLMEAHNFLPHSHDKEISTEYNYWFNFLSEIIGNDLGSGHLEEIILNDNGISDIEPFLFIALHFQVWITPEIAEHNQIFQIINTIPIQAFYLYKDSSHRGPPNLV